MNRVKGADGSHWSHYLSLDKPIDFQMMYGQGVRFYITKGSDSWVKIANLYVDEHFHKYCKEAFKPTTPIKLRGAYHWLQWSVDPTVQWNFYRDMVYSQYPFEFPPILDFEETSVYKWKYNYSDYAWRAQVWLEQAERETGRLPIVYTAEWYLNHFPDKRKLEFLKRYPLWLADYSWMSKVKNAPHYIIPYVWNGDVAIWQKTDKGDGPAHGIASKSICLNEWMGTYDELLKFLEIKPTVPPTEPEVHDLAWLVDMHENIEKHP